MIDAFEHAKHHKKNGHPIVNWQQSIELIQVYPNSDRRQTHEETCKILQEFFFRRYTLKNVQFDDEFYEKV